MSSLGAVMYEEELEYFWVKEQPSEKHARIREMYGIFGRKLKEENGYVPPFYGDSELEPIFVRNEEIEGECP